MVFRKTLHLSIYNRNFPKPKNVIGLILRVNRARFVFRIWDCVSVAPFFCLLRWNFLYGRKSIMVSGKHCICLFFQWVLKRELIWITVVGFCDLYFSPGLFNGDWIYFTLLRSIVFFQNFKGNYFWKGLYEYLFPGLRTGFFWTGIFTRSFECQLISSVNADEWFSGLTIWEEIMILHGKYCIRGLLNGKKFTSHRLDVVICICRPGCYAGTEFTLHFQILCFFSDS